MTLTETTLPHPATSDELELIQRLPAIFSNNFTIMNVEGGFKILFSDRAASGGETMPRVVVFFPDIMLEKLIETIRQLKEHQELLGQTSGMTKQ